MKLRQVNDIDTHVSKHIDKLWVLQSDGNIVSGLLFLFRDKVQGVFDVVVTGEGLVAGKMFKGIVPSILSDGIQVLVT